MVHRLSPRDPQEEDARQAAVARSGILGRRNDPELQAIVEAAMRAYGTAYAAISIIDRARQWVAARIGIEIEETPRIESFCAHAIHRPGEPLIVPNATLDPRFASKPAVCEWPHVRFYAGMPIVDRAGYALGALCVFDVAARASRTDPIELMLLARAAETVIARFR